MEEAMLLAIKRNFETGRFIADTTIQIRIAPPPPKRNIAGHRVIIYTVGANRIYSGKMSLPSANAQTSLHASWRRDIKTLLRIAQKTQRGGITK
jgi:hypothetical protein